MKKVISVLLILVMVTALAACGKKDTPSDAEVTQAADNTKDTEPAKDSETTPEPAKEATPEPTKEAEPEPTEEITPEPTAEPADDPEDDDFYSAGHVYEGIWKCGDCILQLAPEGPDDVINIFYEETDMETYGGWHEYWTRYSEDSQSFICDAGVYYYISEGERYAEMDDGMSVFEVEGDELVWAEMTFEKISDDISDNPYFKGNNDDDYDDDPDNYYSGDVGDGFGAEFVLEQREFVDVIATTYYGVYCENWDSFESSFYYPYYGDEMSMDTMDEYNAAFLQLGIEEDQGQLCFIEKGINCDITWTMEDGKILITDTYSGNEYTGMFYWDTEDQRGYVCIQIGEYDVWMSDKTEVVSEPSDGTLSDEAALSAIEKYCLERNSSLQDIIDRGEYTVYWLVESSSDSEIVVLYRSYTGAQIRYYIDRYSGETYSTSFVPGISESESPYDETLNVKDYWDY